MAASNKEVRAARAYLQKRGITTPMLPPKKLADAAKELNKGFRETLRLLADLLMAGQGRQRARQEIVRKAAEGEVK